MIFLQGMKKWDLDKAEDMLTEEHKTKCLGSPYMSRKGFTLIELLIVLATIGISAAIAIRFIVQK